MEGTGVAIQMLQGGPNWGLLGWGTCRWKKWRPDILCDHLTRVSKLEVKQTIGKMSIVNEDILDRFLHGLLFGFLACWRHWSGLLQTHLVDNRLISWSGCADYGSEFCFICGLPILHFVFTLS